MTLATKYNQAINFNPLNAIDLAAEKIAPTWPLDQSIAVNPWWQLKNIGMQEAAAKLRVLGNVRMLMPKDYYKALWQTEIKEMHLDKAKKQLGVTASTESLVSYLDKPDTHKHWVHISDFLDVQESHQYRISWREEVLEQISHFCAFYLKFPENFNQHTNDDEGFYKAWRASTIADKGMQILTGEKHLHEIFTNLPENIDDLVTNLFHNITDGDVDEQMWNDYVYSLVLDINGWASWLAYDEWQANLNSTKHQHLLKQLVAIKMAWDWVLWQNTKLTDQFLFNKLNNMFISQLYNTRTLQSQAHEEDTYLWVWHTASETKFQTDMHQKLQSAAGQSVEKPVLQAVFCIDVRSEQYRKNLEAQHLEIETYGFAGFFGLPIAHTSKGGNRITPQLPGLLKPSLIAQQSVSTSEANNTQTHLKKKLSWKLAADSAGSTFGMVESQGLFKVFDLLKQTIFGSTPERVIATKDIDQAWEINSDGNALDTDALASLAKGILTGMGLRQPYAEKVLIVGHGSFSTNNPHASGLDCGACGGQTGEVNALVLCYLLNRDDIREALSLDEIKIPTTTTFVPCLHNTVTDEIAVLNTQEGQWLNWLHQATVACQSQRAKTEGIDSTNQWKIDQILNHKSKDWAQLRPEWGLANNGAFVVAPRAYTRDVDFEGRSFLHDYDWQTDQDFKILEQIMTAPMIVTNWINLQYYASTTDNQHYGSGNKMLHNVVGGNFGVFEGNGGDLRIGLPQQSLHDGTKWRHNPVRLNVYLTAPQDAIDEIIQKHEMVKDLITNEWLFLFQWDYATNTIWVYKNGGWEMVQGNSQQALVHETEQTNHKQIQLDGWTVEIPCKKIEVNGCMVETTLSPSCVGLKDNNTKLNKTASNVVSINQKTEIQSSGLDVEAYLKKMMPEQILSDKSSLDSDHTHSQASKPYTKKLQLDGWTVAVPRKAIKVNGCSVEVDDVAMVLKN